MNYAPEDLDAKTFCTSMVGGYRKSAVDETIQSIAADYREAEKEMAELKSKVSVLTETVEHYKTIEESMQHCLIIAQHTSDEMVRTAGQKSRDILSEADATSQKMINDAYQQVNKIKSSYDEIKAQIYSFRVKSEALIKSQLDVLNQLSGGHDE